MLYCACQNITFKRYWLGACASYRRDILPDWAKDTTKWRRLWDSGRQQGLSHVLHCLDKGWPSTCDKVLSPLRNKLSVFQGYLMWGSKVIIPKRTQSTVLLELHKGHPGMIKL